jgi:iron complex outermembrane receptor protein
MKDGLPFKQGTSMKPNTPSVCIMIACSALANTNTHAEIRVEEILVSASRTSKPITAIPNTVKVIDRKALDAQLATSTSLLDAISFVVPSLTPAHQKMTSNGVTLRGRTPLYMADGIPQSTPLRNGERSGFTVDPAFVDRVEVIYGANAIQGVGATGGVINFVTIDAPASGELLKTVSTNVITDNFESNGLHYKVTGVVGKTFDNKDFVIGLAHDVQDLYYDGDGAPIAIDPIQGDTMDSQTWNVFTKVGLDLDEYQRIELTANYFELKGDGDYRVVNGDMLAGIPATSESGEAEGDPTYNEALNLSVAYSHNNVFGGELTVQGFYYDFYALYGGGTFPAFQDSAIAAAGTLYDQSALNSEKYGTKLTYVRDNTFWEGLQLATGIDYLQDKTYQDLAQTGRIWVPEMIYQGWAPFVQLEQRLVNDRLRLSFGSRLENVELDVPSFTTVAGANNTFVEGGEPGFEELLSNAGIVFDVTEELTVFASYAEGFTMPDAGLILRSVSTPGQTIDSLIDLQPVVADNVETGVNFHRGGIDIAASYFWSSSDLGSRILVVDGIGQLTRQKTEIEGLEISASYHFNSGVSTGLAYSKLEGRFDSSGDGSVDKDLDGRNIAPDRINVYVEAPLAAGWNGRLQYARLLDRDFDGGQPQHDFDGYSLLDAVVSYRNPNLGDFTLGIENLMDENYITYYSQTLTYVNNSTYFAGRGRAINLGWQKTF